MAGQKNLAKKFFTKHHDDFVQCLNLYELIPRLNSKELITLDEFEQLNLNQPRSKKISYLVQIMSTKGPTAPALFVECVRNASDHLPHSELADNMTRWLQLNGQHTDTPTNRTEEQSQQLNSNRSHQDSAACSLQSRVQAGRSSSNHSLIVNVHVHTNIPSSDNTTSAPVSVTSSNEHHSLSQPIHDQASGREAEEHSLGLPIQEQSIDQPFSLPTQGHQTQSRSSVPQTLPPPSSATFEPAVQESSSSSHSHATQRHNSGAIPLYRNQPCRFEDGLPSAMDQLLRVVPSYAEIVQTLASKLSEKGISIGTVVDQLNSLLHNSHIDVAISVEEVRDFPSLCLNLRNCGLCHEVDVDLLCKLFSEDVDLHSVVKQYAENIMDNGTSPFENGSSSSQTHYLLTFHNNTEMNVGQVFQVKDFIASLLQIRRHTFTLAATRPGSTVIVWRIPTAFHKQAITVLESEKAKLTLHKDRSLQKVELEHTEGGQVFVREVYSKAEQLFDRSISSTTDNDDKDESTTFSTVKRRLSQSEGDTPTSTQLRPPEPTPPEFPTAPGSVDEEDLQQSRGVKRRAQPSTDLPPSRRPRSLSDQYHHTTTEASPTLAEYTISSQFRYHPFASSHPADTPLQVLTDTLRASYRDHRLFKKAAAPKLKEMQFINLALIMKQNISHAEREKDQFLQSTLHGSVDYIVKKKKEIKELKKIFEYGTKGTRKLVLVEGAPGVGKTMLALKLCQDWAEGKLLDEYSHVFLVPLRRFQGKPSVELNDIINISLEGTVCYEATQALLQKQGEKALIILEGWDELPPELREEGSFFFDLIEGFKLPKASILVTSRPTVTADLNDYMDERHIEVLGFNSEQIVEYVKFHGKDMADTIIGHLNKFPNLKALAHIPLTLAIVCNVASKEATLPHTLTELYDQFICNTLLENLKRKQPVKAFKSLIGLSSLEGLPEEVRTVIDSLCALALDGFKEKKFVYSQKDLKGVGIEVGARKAFDGFSLLNTPINAAVAGFEQVFQFNHLSIQEFLAAYGIQQLEYEDRVALLREYRRDKQFRNIWKFFAGITRLEDEDFRNIVVGETTMANKDQIFLLHCLYEANNSAISQKAAEKMNRDLNLNNMLLNTTDCLCAAHVITSAGGEWNVDLRACNIGEDGLRIFKTSLMGHVETHGAEAFTIKRFDLTHNRIKAGCIGHLAEMLTTDMELQSLVLASNSFGDLGMKTLATALKRNNTTKVLHFSSCELTTAAAFELAAVLEENTKLKEIYIGFEPLGCQGVTRLAQALEVNRTLTEISLTHTDMTPEGLVALARMAAVNDKLEVLRLDRNNFGPVDCDLVATIVAKNNSLVLIDLSKNPIQDRGFDIILEALINKPGGSIKKLGVFGCELTEKGLKKLPKFFAVTQSFVGIQLGCNKLGDKGAKMIGEALLQNSSKTVKQVLLETTGVSDEGKQKLQKIVDTVNLDREEDNKLDLNYEHHAQVVKQRNARLSSSTS